MRSIPLRFRASPTNPEGVPYVIPVTSMGNPSMAIANALATRDNVMIPAGSWTLSSTVTVPSGKALQAHPGATLVTAVAIAFTMTGCFRSVLRGVRVSGPHSGTSYQIIITDSVDCEIDVAISNGNSGINLIRSDFNWVRLNASEMRGTAIKLTGSQNNDVALLNGRNISGFGVYAEKPSAAAPRQSSGNRLYSEKYLDAAFLTAYQLSGAASANYDSVRGRIGLEGIGLTRADDALYGSNGSNIILGGYIRHTDDNGVSITSDGNTGGNLVIEDCDHDGLHLYGSFNAFSSVVSRRCRFSGLGISRSSTLGGASGNSVVGLVAEENEEYGVELKDIADGNYVIFAPTANVLGASSDTSSGSNNLGVGGGGGSGDGGGNGVLYIIPTGDMASPHSAITAALAAYDRVMIPAGTWAVNSTIVMASGKTLTAAPGCTITTTTAQIITMTGVTKARAVGLSITGPNTGTSYQIIMTDCTDCEVDVAIRNGNSGVHLVRSDFCKVRADLREMRGAGIRLSGAQNNDIRLVSGRNIGGFGVYLALDGSRISTKNRIGAEKYCDPATLTAFQLEAGFYEAETGRIGLEAVGITVGNDGNIIDGVLARDTGDNGISVTSNGNSGGNFIIENCGHDGLHVYGSFNSFSSVTARGNNFSGLGISQSSTTGTASGNSVVGVVSDLNGQYGVEIGDIADKNFIIAAIGENTLGPSRDTSSGSNNLGLAGGVAVQSESSQASFVGVLDLSPNYVARTAYWRHADYYCDFWVSLRITPTYTSPETPGEFRIRVPGLPTAFSTPGLLVSGVAGLMWPAGATQLSARFESGSIIRIRAQGPTLDAMSLNTDHFPSGQQVSLTISGRYQTADAGGSGGGGGGGGGSSAWGGITGTMSAQTDLQAALDAKQPLAAVLTGTTASFTAAQESKLAGIATAATANATDAVLRDRSTHTGTQAAATITDLATVATSGAFADLTGKPTSMDGYGVTDIAEPWNTPPSGELVMTTIGGSDTLANSARVANALEMFQFVPKATITISQVVLNVVTGMGLGRVLIYDTDAEGLPTTLLYNSGDIDTSSAGAKSADCAMTLPRGKRFWIATWFSAALTMSVWATTSMPDINGGTTPTTAARKVARRTVTFASAPPDPWGWSSAEITSARPAAVWLRVA